MGLPIANLQDAGSLGGKAMTGTFGKLIGSVAGLLLLIKLVSESFFFVPVGYRGVLKHGGQPIKRRSGKQVGPIFVKWLGPRTGPYKIKYKGVGMKIPFYTTVEKVNIQQRIQHLPKFIADCPDGQREIDADLATRIPCELDGPEFADYPARVVIKSSEADQVFESYCGTALVDVLETAEKTERDNREWLRDSVNSIVGEDVDAVGYLLEGVNLRSRALTPIQKAIDGFSPPKAPAYESYSSDNLEADENSNVVLLPHPMVITTALGQIAEPS